MSRRVAIIGNSGSGKSHLAGRLAARLGVRAVELDSIFWLPDGFNSKRSPEDVDPMIAAVRSDAGWVVESVFGDLVGRFVDLADLLIWLDLPWDVCRASLLGRGSVSSTQNDPVRAEESFRNLLAWASEYWARTDLRSYAGHAQMYTEFDGQKHRFSARDEVDQFMSNLEGQAEQALQAMQ